MERYSIIKSFPEIGKIEYKVVSTKDEFEQSCALVYREYLLRGFILPQYYKSGLRITPQHILPGTTTFIALKDKEVVATNTIMPDSPLGLSMDMGYKEELDKLRRQNRKISEAGYLAIKSELFGRGLFSMFNFKKLDFMFTLFKLILQYALYVARLDDICIVTNPQYMIFKFLPFKIIGPVKYYGYDRASIKKKAAVPKRLDLRKVDGWAMQKIALRKMFLDNPLPAQMFENRYAFSPQDISYFFAEKSEILQKLTRAQKEYICSCYGFSEQEFKKLI